MTTLADYPEKDLIDIRRIPFMIAILMEGTSRTGILGSAQERTASLNSILSARTTYPDNLFIQGLLPQGTEKEALNNARKRHDLAMDKLTEEGVETPEALWTHLKACLKKNLPVIREREGERVQADYKEWLMHIAQSVAKAAKEGDFLGVGGTKFSEREKRRCKELQVVLRNL